jgi:hypothetical protein
VITVCKACGLPVGSDPRLPRIKQIILDTVRARPGISAEALRCAVWADDPGGGPECRHTIYAHIYQLNKQIAPLGVAVRSAKGGTSGYQILKL